MICNAHLLFITLLIQEWNMKIHWKIIFIKREVEEDQEDIHVNGKYDN